MADFGPQFEYADNQGTTEVFGGVAGTSTGNWTTSNKNVPAAAGSRGR